MRGGRKGGDLFVVSRTNCSSVAGQRVDFFFVETFREPTQPPDRTTVIVGVSYNASTREDEG